MNRIPVVKLGGTGLKVSKLGFGTYDFGRQPLEISPKKGGQILFEAYKLGANFWDTSDDYGSHPHVAAALKLVSRKDVVISTKTNARRGGEAENSLKNSLKELGTDYVDIFLLHNVKSDWVDDCGELFKELRALKATGMVMAVGLSTHSVAVVQEVAQLDEVDVIMTICCNADQATIKRFQDHIPLEDGTIKEMLKAIELAHNNGKGLVAMKVLGGTCPNCQLSPSKRLKSQQQHPAPPLARNYESSIKSIVKMKTVDTMVIGMENIEQLQKNVKAVLSIY
jgi:aryl-alcohol dehydrogenase-like predicted oxidoreductase